MTTEAPRSPPPASQRGSNMKLAPRKAEIAPEAMATEFIVTTFSRGTTCGNAADKPEATNRAKPLASRATHSSKRSPAPTARIVPTAAMKISHPDAIPIIEAAREDKSELVRNAAR